MIGRIRHTAFTKVFWVLMGIYLLNTSVDAPDPSPMHMPEDLSFNDQESIIEIIVEQVLGYENAISEYDDQDSHEKKSKRSLKIELAVYSNKSTNKFLSIFDTSKKRFCSFDAHLTMGFQKLDTPPPKA